MTKDPGAELAATRVRSLNSHRPNADGEFVVYWMIAARRPRWNHALDRAVELATAHARPLVVLEPLRVGYRWASDRHHGFVIDGMKDNARHFAERGVRYYPYLEPEEGDGKGLLAALAARSTAVVTDDSPAFFLPRMLAAAAEQVEVPLEAVDSNGILPLSEADKLFSSAYHFRRFLQNRLPDWLGREPADDPLAQRGFEEVELPSKILKRWPMADLEKETAELVSQLPLDHSVGMTGRSGGFQAAAKALDRFMNDRLARYDSDRNEPGADATSELSPWLHFGHLSSHEVVSRLLDKAGWKARSLKAKATGARSGWWGLEASEEAFLDQIITWRELGFNRCHLQPDYDQYRSLPDWARATLAEHQDDERPHQYRLEQFEQAETHDELWNAAQRQLVRQGVIHNYLRMLWGKKILEWSGTPQEALATMIELNNKYAIDGRDPNSYSGIMWVLGRFDRGWPERPVFGKVRSMTSSSTARKHDVSGYLKRWAE